MAKMAMIQGVHARGAHAFRDRNHARVDEPERRVRVVAHQGDDPEQVHIGQWLQAPGRFAKVLDEIGFMASGAPDLRAGRTEVAWLRTTSRRRSG